MIIGPAIEAAHAVGFAGEAGQHDHRQIGIDARGPAVGSADAVEQVQAATTLEPQVEQNERRPPHVDRAQALRRCPRARHPEPVGDKIVSQKALRRLVVLDDQDQRAARPRPDEGLAAQKLIPGSRPVPYSAVASPATVRTWD
jgi:hypothetical protein